MMELLEEAEECLLDDEAALLLSDTTRFNVVTNGS